ncbi:MAG: hypothetical protein IPL79_18770 [Myxococcales bacterium]|nr:hypothetical protein [Myxococcales bacterium]
MRTTSAVAIAAGALAAMVACQERHVADAPIAGAKVAVKRWPVDPNNELDLLWVIDNSNSMAGEQANLIANFPAFIDVLSHIGRGMPNLHMGVVSTDGRQLGLAGCGGGGGTLRAPAGKSPFISDVLPDGSDTRVTSWASEGYASLADAFSAYANLGTGGCGFEQPFQSVIDAVNPATNPGFIRPNAYLAIIFLTDEDDCSGAVGSNALFENTTSAAGTLGPLASFRCWEYGVTCDGDAPSNERTAGVRHGCEIAAANPYAMELSDVTSALAAIKPKRNTIIATIAGDTDPSQVRVINTPSAWAAELTAVTLAPSCVQQGAGDVYASAEGEQYIARPAVRLQALVNHYRGFGTTEQSICASDLTPALMQIAGIIIDYIGNPCIDGELADQDATAPGLQPNCQVSVVTDYGEANQTEVMLAPCGEAATTECWQLASDPYRCPEADHLFLETKLTPTLQDHRKTILANCALL